ncbi:hypothetical protein [Streptomyces sp. SAJ15]|uniref:hypothetical protein n=1 Tax=Streptomyces sp. SAJ15 TaxID=2011095 RepID=UPI0011847085|nr:hypothetical protein [Streptomyces sp. SAJ15]TVL90451.1 hypothetical protein CD790_20945 [Streptomyces sp. SAJ15]
MINVQGIPLFTGNLEQLETDALAFKTIAGKIRKTGSDIHTSFQTMKSFYEAPEAEQLFGTTAVVRDTADDFAGELEWIWSALDSYAIEIRPIVEKLKSLVTQAALFVDSVEDEAGWERDQDKVDEHNEIFDAVEAAVKAFRAAEERAHDSIAMLHGGTTLKDKAKAYEARAEKADKPEEAPWGKPAEKKYSKFDATHYIYEGLEGFFIDGVWGTIDGLLTLTGFHGIDEMKASWKGLAMLGVGATVWMSPYWRNKPEDALPEFLRESKQVAKETGKSLVAYDQWKKNPGRATGVVVFNGLTAIAAPTKAGQAANAASKGAKAINAIRQGGRLADPMTYVTGALGKAGSVGKVKVADVVAGLKNVYAGRYAELPDGSLRFGDNTVVRPDGTLELPNGQAYDKDGSLYNADGTLHQHAKDVPQERSANERLQGEDVSLARDHELAGVGGRENELNATNRTGDNPTPHGRNENSGTGPPASQDVSEPSSHGSGSGDVFRGDRSSPVAHDAPVTGSGGHAGAGSGHDGPGGGGHDGPDGTGAHGQRGQDGLPSGDEPRPFERGGEAEQKIRDQLRGSKVKPGDLEKVLDNLSRHPAGQEIADTIASGRHTGSEGYDQVVSSLSHADKMAGGIEQLRLADRLQASGVRDIAFEAKAGYELKPGVVTGERTDLDVVARDSDGTTYGYQFKDIQNPKKLINKILSNRGQLIDSRADVQTFVIDTKGTLEDLAANNIAERLSGLYGSYNMQFVIRVEDGTLMIPPGGKFTPGGIS